MKSASAKQVRSLTAERTVQDYIAIMKRGRWVIFATFAVIFGAAVLYTQLAQRIYRATSSVRIDIKQLQSSLFREPTNTGGNMNVIQNELEILKSTSLADVVARRLLEQRYIDTLDHVPMQIVQPSTDTPVRDSLASVDEVTGRLLGSVDFEPVRESDVIKVMAKSPNPREAMVIANLYAQSYFDRNVYASRTKSRSFRQFLESQVKSKQGALAQSEESLRRYMELKGVVSLDDNSKRIIEQLSQLQSQHDAVDITIQSLEKTLSSYKEQVTQQEQSVSKVMGEANDPYIRLLQDQLAQLEVQRDITVAQNPDFVGKEVYNTKLNEIEGQIQNLKAKLKKRTDEFLVNLLPSSGNEQRDPAGYLKQVKQKSLEAQVELQALMARKKALAEAIADYNRQFENLPKKNMEFARLQRDKMSLEKLYLAIEEKYNEANITEQGELGYIDIFDPAVAPGQPSSPRVALSLVLGAILGLGFGVGLVLVREYLRVVIRTPEDIKKRGFVLLATVMRIGEEARVAPRDGKAAGSAKQQVAPQLVMITNPLSPIAESYRHLRTTVQLSKSGVSPHTILVTSPSPGEGKTTTVANLAVALARAGKRTLLVDADLRRPTIHSSFGLHMKPGLSEILANEATLDQALQKTEIHDLQVMTSGAIPANPAEFLGSEKMRRLVESLKQSYDTVVFDCPPVLAVTDASVLSSLVDRVIMVVSAGNTNAESLDAAIETLEGVGVTPAGVVLNNFSLKHAYGGHYASYGYGYYNYAQRGEKKNGHNDGQSGKVRSQKQ